MFQQEGIRLHYIKTKAMATTNFIAVIELSSSKIVGLAGRKNDNGAFKILAHAKHEASACIRRGIVFNIDKVAQALTSIIVKMEEQLESKIAKVYVTTSGQSLQSRLNIVERNMDGEIYIDQAMVDAIADENLNQQLDNFEILDVIPQEYTVGDSQQIDPKGVICSYFKGNFLNIIARETIRRRIEQGFAKANIEIGQIFITPLVTAEGVLTEGEIRAGCALVDFGADTTTITIYKNRVLRYLAVLPLGSNSITSDIAFGLKIEEDEAEELKVTYGDAQYEDSDSDNPATFLLSDNLQSIRHSKLNDIIAGRATEIIENVWNLIISSGYAEQLYAGIIITGGGANLKNLDSLLRKRSKIDKMRFAKATTYSIIHKDKMPLSDGMYNAVTSLLSQGKEDSMKFEPVVETEKVEEKPIVAPTHEESIEREGEQIINGESTQTAHGAWHQTTPPPTTSPVNETVVDEEEEEEEAPKVNKSEEHRGNSLFDKIKKNLVDFMNDEKE